jgi:CheY-like chemotaxis protein
LVNSSSSESLEVRLARAEAEVLRLTQDNARLIAEGAAAGRRRDELLALLGHELRNPLAPIVASLDLIRLRGGAPGGRELEIIERQVHHLRRLVNDLLDVSRLARGAVTLQRAAVRVQDALTDALEACEHLLLARKHHVSVDVPPELQVDADPARMTQVLINVIGNAAKYTPPGGQIAVRALVTDGGAVISVKDNGRGISPQLLPHVFELFHQGAQTIDRGDGGLGLGLAIVKNLAELHGGSASAASAGPDQGTEVILRWPLAGAEEAPPAPRASTHRPRKILVVDDNVDAAETLADMLRLLGHEVVVAYNAIAALATAETAKPQLALLDLGLPVVDGYQLAQQIRAHPELAKVSLVALTGYGSERERDRAKAAGFDHHLVKPLDPDLLAKLLDDEV